MKGRELLELVGAAPRAAPAPTLRARVGEMLERTGLTDAGERRIGGYSGGMRQRLGIAQALLHQPATPLPRRAGQLARPGGPARPPRADRRAARRGDGRLLDPRPVRRRADLRPGRDPRPRPARDGGAARRAARAPTPARSTGSCPRPARTPRSRALVDRAAGGAVDDGRRRRRRTGAIRVTVSDADAAARRAPAARRRRGRRPRRRSSGPARRSRTSSSSSSGRRRADELDGRGFVRPREVGPMTGFAALLRKELLEQWRTIRLPVVAAVFLLVGLSLAAARPVHARDHRGGRRRPVPDRPADRRRPPTRSTSSSRTSASSGSSSRSCWRWARSRPRRSAGRPALILTKPVGRGAFLVAKLVAIAATLGGRDRDRRRPAAWFYTLVLFEPLPVAGFAAAAVLQWLALVAFAAITFLGSTLTRSALAAAGHRRRGVHRARDPEHRPGDRAVPARRARPRRRSRRSRLGAVRRRRPRPDVATVVLIVGRRGRRLARRSAARSSRPTASDHARPRAAPRSRPAS